MLRSHFSRRHAAKPPFQKFCLPIVELQKGCRLKAKEHRDSTRQKEREFVSNDRLRLFEGEIFGCSMCLPSRFLMYENLPRIDVNLVIAARKTSGKALQQLHSCWRPMV